eukprot:711823-Rhodomonas_salina.1
MDKIITGAGIEQYHISVWKGEAQGRKREDDIWRMETAKAHQWLAQAGWHWHELSSPAVRYTQRASEAEAQGFRMWAWDLLDRVRGTDVVLVLLDAIPPQWQTHALNEAARAEALAVVAQAQMLSEEEEEWLLANTPLLLITLYKDKIRIYTKGWWKLGMKKLWKAPPGALRVWQSMLKVCKEDWEQNCTGLLHNPCDIQNLDARACYEVYWDHQPSSPN